MSATVYARLLPYEAELWMPGFHWRGEPQALTEQVERAGVRQILVPTTAGNPVPRRIAGAVLRPVPLALHELPAAARLTGVASVYRTAPPFCEGDLLRREVTGAKRAVLLLLGPETVGWALRQGALRDSFRSLDEEAIGGRTTGAVETRWVTGRLVEEGENFARRLFSDAGLAAMPEGLPAWVHRLRMAVGRLAAATGGRPDVICLGGERRFVTEARQALGDLAPTLATNVAWGLAAWAVQREEHEIHALPQLP